MKKIIPFLSIVLLSSCVISIPQEQKVDSKTISVAVGQEAHAGIGDTFFSNEVITGTDNGYGYISGSGEKMELTVAGITNEKLTLNYAEYMKPLRMNEYGGAYFLKSDGWIIKSGFNSQFQYDLTTSKTVTFKGYEFQILDSKDNTVTYTRTK